MEATYPFWAEVDAPLATAQAGGRFGREVDAHLLVVIALATFKHVVDGVRGTGAGTSGRLRSVLLRAFSFSARRDVAEGEWRVRLGGGDGCRKRVRVQAGRVVIEGIKVEGDVGEAGGVDVRDLE